MTTMPMLTMMQMLTSDGNTTQFNKLSWPLAEMCIYVYVCLHEAPRSFVHPSCIGALQLPLKSLWALKCS